MDVCAYVLQHIGGDLTSLEANGFHQIELGHEQTCVFLSKGHKIAIPWSVQDGLTCFLTRDLDSKDDSYPTWTPLWKTGVVAQPDDLDEYIAQFPDSDDELLRFIGSKLREYFAENHR